MTAQGEFRGPQQMTAVLEMKALIDRGPWNDVIRTVVKDNEKRDPTSPPQPKVNLDYVRCGRPSAVFTFPATTKTVNVKDDSGHRGDVGTRLSPKNVDADSEKTISSTPSALVSSMKQLNSTTSIGFSIARILGNSIITNRCANYGQSTPASQQSVESTPVCRTYDDGRDWMPRRRSLTPAAGCDLPTTTVPSVEVHRDADLGTGRQDRHRSSPHRKFSGDAVRTAVVPSHPQSARRQCADNRKPSVDDVSDDGEGQVEENDDEMDDDQSDNQSDPTDVDVDYDLKKDADSDDITGFDDDDGEGRFAIDSIHRRPLGDLPDCISGFEKLTWLQCTRYKPPKLPRSKKLRDGSKKRKLGRNPRVPFTQHQVAMLEHKFSRTHYLSSVDVAELSATLNLTENRVKIWFQNRRARERRNKDPQILASGPTDDVIGYPSPPSDRDQGCTKSSSMSPSSMSSPLPHHQHTQLGGGYRSPTPADFFHRDSIALAGYPEIVMRQFNSSTRGGFAMPFPHFPPTMRQLPTGLRLHPGCLVAGDKPFAADLFAHLHQSSSSMSSSSSLSSSVPSFVTSAASSANTAIAGLPGMMRAAAAAAGGVVGRHPVSALSPHRGFMR